MKSMKMFRDLFAAIMIGMMGGFLVSTISYYKEHKEGGVIQTVQAVLNSFDSMAQMYGKEGLVSATDGELDSNYATTKSSAKNTIVSNIEDVFDAREEAKEEVSDNISIKTAFRELHAGDTPDYDGDILAMNGEDGNVANGEPYRGILRFHVRANSDSKEDQELKMAVKEDVISMLRPVLADCKTVIESKTAVVANLQNIYTTCINTIVEQGYDYDVKVYVTEEEFPVKTYGDLTFPAGDYQALRIDIGEAKGQNWWCVMFPPLCFVDESTAVVSQEGKEALKRVLTSKEYDALYAYYRSDEESDVTVKGESFLYNWIKEKMKAASED